MFICYNQSLSAIGLNGASAFLQKKSKQRPTGHGVIRTQMVCPTRADRMISIYFSLHDPRNTSD